MSPVPVIGQLTPSESQTWIDALSPCLTDVEFCTADGLSEDAKRHVRYAVVANPTPQQLAEFPSLVWVQSVWAGVEKLVDTFADSNIGVTRLIDPNLSATMAESALLWCLYLNRDMHQYAAFQKQRLWQSLPYRTTAQCTVGILGLGELGTACASQLMSQGFNVIGWSRTAKADTPFQHLHGKAALPSVLADSDILLNLLPLTRETRNLLTMAQWRLCRPGLKVINFGRGPTVNEGDLITALEEDILDYAVLDVFEQEPLPASHPYWGHPKITVLPHISAPTSIESAAAITAQNLRSKLAGSEPATVDFSRGY